MSRTLLVITDGRRSCLERALESFDQHVPAGLFGHRMIVDDAQDDDFTAWLRKTFRFDQYVRYVEKLGFGGAIRAGWHNLTRSTEWVFHLEDDFVFERYVDVPAMEAVLDRHPDIVQMALRRQPWNDEEIAAGSYVGLHPEDYVDRGENSDHWLEHRRFFTTNPCIYRMSLTRKLWPEGPESEGRFGLNLFKDPQAVCAIWGKRDDDPWVTHIGQRIGTGY